MRRRSSQGLVSVQTSTKRCKVSPASSGDAIGDFHNFDLQCERQAVPVSAALTMPDNTTPADENNGKLRFAPGDEVECCTSDGWWVQGTVIALHGKYVDGESTMSATCSSDDTTTHEAPYCIMINDDRSVVTASDGMVRKRCSRAPDQRALPERVEDIVAEQIEFCDPRRTLCAEDFFDILTDLTETVTRVMVEEGRNEFDNRDRAFITQSVRRSVHPGPGASEAMVLVAPSRTGCSNTQNVEKMRFSRLDHVVCRLQGHWASGVVHAMESAADSPAQEKPQCIYVMLDGPNNSNSKISMAAVNEKNDRLVAVPEDACHLQRAATAYHKDCITAVHDRSSPCTVRSNLVRCH